MASPSTPPPSDARMASNCEYTTPMKQSIRAVIAFNDAHGLPYYKEDVFRFFHVEREAGYLSISMWLACLRGCRKW